MEPVQGSFTDRIKNTGFLLKHSFTIAGKDKDIKTPLLLMILFSFIVTTLFWVSVAAFFLRQIWAVPLLLFTAFILVPFTYFYNVRQKANQSWIVYNTLTGKDIGYADAREHTRTQKGRLRFIALIDLVFGYSRRGKRNRRSMLAQLILSALSEVWDLISNYMIPAVVIEQKSLLDLAPQLQGLRKNIPATLAGVFGIDFAGNVVLQALSVFRWACFALAVWLGYVLAPVIPHTAITVFGLSFSWLPILLMLYLLAVIAGIVRNIIDSIKIIYFTIFYTSITRPASIRKDMRSELTSYLLMGGRK